MDHELTWKYAEEFGAEPTGVELARQHAHELGIDSVSPATGAQLALLAAASGARSMLEIGTGSGVSGLYLLSGAPQGSLTSIDVEPDHLQAAREAFGTAAPPSRTRLITGAALEVLPRMNDGAYDLVLLDADPGSVIDYLEHGLRVARVGGLVLVAHALWRGRVADPVQRDDTVADYRAMLGAVRESQAVLAAMSTAGDGLLQLVKLSD